MKKKFSLLFFIFNLLAFSQSGENVYPFLNIPVSARQAALGGDAVSVRDFDVSFAGINPALMNLDQDQRISMSFANYLAGSKYGTFAYVKDLGRGNLVTFNGRYMDYGSTPRTDESSQISGEFNAIDATIGAGYALQFEENWTIGMNLNFITSKIDTFTSMAVGASGGVTYYNEKSNETLSLVFRNFGYQFKPFNGVRETLPFRADLGYTKILDNFPLAVTVTAHDLQQLNISQNLNTNGQQVRWTRKAADHFSLGFELFPAQAFNVRLGYNVKRGNELAVLDQRNFSGLSAGFGIKISSFKFDYSHVRYNNSSNVNLIGISLDLIELSGDRR
ncbi:type IX secretion system protein PorQ [Halpernia frigidisoli]|uniref:Penicillin-binding protein n=1 Tax=Halpernia frigidisoli TaxID=1125876 RepID=A0A1I3EFX0_9FLAO|nr:type IX secretion system protein PorQ [Halpernia frigidisoli]SFH97790.1 hypothetical protein SAMN05443292_1054 [Halpernia frigidisoli]